MYKTKHAFVFNRDDCFNSIIGFALECGWTLYDDISEFSKVITSKGENDNLIGNIYVHIYSSVENYINCVVYGFWNITNHSGLNALNTSSSGLILSKVWSDENTLYNRMEIYLIGSKDYIMTAITLYDNSTQYFLNINGFGALSHTLSQIIKTTSLPVDVGSDISVQLDSVEGLYVNNYYQILDKSFKKGAERVLIKYIDKGTNTVVLNNVTVGFPDGVYLGLNIMPVFLFNDDNAHMRNLYSFDKLGTNLTTVYYRALSLFRNENDSYSAPTTTNYLVENMKNIINRNIFYDSYTGLPAGYFDENIRSNSFVLYKVKLKSVLCYNDDNSDFLNDISYLTHVSDNFSYVEDIRKNWTIDSLKDRYLVIITGCGAGQSRKILSNTVNGIYLVNNFLLTIDKTSQYVIVDKVYRVLTNVSASGSIPSFWFKDIF